MPYSIEEKLVIAVASSALFALDEADAVFRKEGMLAYRKYQREHETDILSPGIAFPFVRRFLELNTVFPERQPVEVVLLSRRAEVHTIGSHSIRYCNPKQTAGD